MRSILAPPSQRSDRLGLARRRLEARDYVNLRENKSPAEAGATGFIAAQAMIPDPDRPAPAAPRLTSECSPRAGSDQEHAAAAIAAAGALLLRIRQDSQLRDLLAAEEIDAVALENGAACREFAAATLADCQVQLDTLDRTALAREEAFAAARRDFAAFRRAVRQACDRAEATRLLPRRLRARPLREFVGRAHAAYIAALAMPTIDALAAHGFDAARLCRSVSVLVELAALDDAFAARTAAAAAALDARSRALNRLNAWIRDLLAATQQALSRTPPPRLSRRRASHDRRTAPVAAFSVRDGRMLPPRFDRLRD